MHLKIDMTFELMQNEYRLARNLPSLSGRQIKSLNTV